MMTNNDPLLCQSCRTGIAYRIKQGIALQRSKGQYHGGRPRIPEPIENAVLEAARSFPEASLRKLARIIPASRVNPGRRPSVSFSTIRRILIRNHIHRNQGKHRTSTVSIPTGSGTDK